MAAVENRFLEYTFRVVFLFFGVIDLFSIFWHQESMGKLMILSGIALAVSEVAIGFLSWLSLSRRNFAYIFIFVCMIGIILSAHSLYHGLIVSYGVDWFVVVVRAVFILMFIYLIKAASSRMAS